MCILSQNKHMPLSDKHRAIVKKILASKVYDVAIVSPLDHLKNFSEEFQNTVYLKREDAQPVHSFKLRGAYNKISQLSEDKRQAGVIAASAGNHAQGVAFSCQHLGIQATIVMPITTPPIKVDAVKRYGAKVILHGDSYDYAYQEALSIATKEKLSFVHPYDDEDVIAGQGTIAKEVLDVLHGDIDYIFIPVGGGGLFAGMLTYIKTVFPKIKVIAVEAEDSACLHEALKQGKRHRLEQVGIFADGVAVKQVGKHPFELVKDLCDDTVQVSTDEICAGIKDIYDDIRAVSEPAGALSLAGIKKYLKKKRIKDKTIVGILSGANVNFHRLRHISERAQIGEKEEALFAVEIPEQRGSFLRFCKYLSGKAITEFNYRYQSEDKAVVFVGIALNDGEAQRQDTHNYLKKEYKVIDLTDNETAKLHIRYMIGGKTSSIQDEALYRFQFPERPGALLNFLVQFGSEFNITLFHYRNHGAAYGRVLAGIEVSDNEKALFKQRLDQLNYSYYNESNNPAFDLFL